MTTPALSPQECEQRFWARYGPYLFGQGRKPQTAQEWLDAGLQLRGLQQLDALAARLVAAAAAAQVAAPRPPQRQRTGQEDSIYYDAAGHACCPIHEKPLTHGKFGYFCTAKDPTGKNGYCDFRTKRI